MICKPVDWKEVDDNFIDCPLARARIFTAEELGVNEDILTRFKLSTPKTFILIRGNKKYTVNTEGYNYIRYIQRIP